MADYDTSVTNKGGPGMAVSVFLTRYLDKSGELNEKGKAIFAALNLNPSDMVEKTVDDFIEEENSR